jgi:hypothetical protein
MKRTLLTTIAAASLCAGSAMAVTIDFESSANGFATNTFSGLMFNEDIQVIENFGAKGSGQSGKVARQATPPFGAQPRGGSVSGSFDGFTVSSLSFNVGDSGGDNDIFRLLGFDAFGTQIADSGVLSSASAITVAIFGPGISSFSLDISDAPNTGGSSVFDNIAFDQELAAVPLPASLPLIGVGMFALGFLGRRRTA